MNKWRLILALNLVAVFVFIQPTLVAANKKTTITKTIAVKLRLSQDFYHIGDSFTIKAQVVNKSKLTKKYNRLTLSIFSPLKKSEPFLNPNIKYRYKILRRDWYKTLPPGKTTISVTRKIDNKRWLPGVYPVEFRLTLASQEKFVTQGYLTILDQQVEPFVLSLGVNLHQPLSQAPNKVFVDHSLTKLIGETTDKPGPLWGPLKALKLFPDAKLNLVVSPLLLKQLEQVSDGYRYKKDQQDGTIVAKHGPISSAKSWLTALAKKTKQGQVELLTTSYGNASLTDLEALNWQTDIDRQLKKAKSFWQARPQFKITGFAPFSLILNNAVLNKLDGRFPYTLIKASHLKSKKKDAIFKAQNRKISLIAPEAEGSYWLSKVEAAQIGNELAALIAHKAVNQGQKRMVLFTNKLIQAQVIEELLLKVKELTWVKLVSFSDLLAEQQTVARLRSFNQAQPQLLTGLKKARQNYLSFATVVAPTNEVKKSLEEKLLIAESGDWNQNKRGLGLSYVKAVNQQVSKEFSKIKLAPPTQITFSTPAGKVPVLIKNRANYPFKISLIAKDENLKIIKKLPAQVVEPKENLIAFDVARLRYGTTPLLIEAKAGQHLIAQARLVVNVSSSLRVLVVTSGVTILLIVAVYLFFKFFKVKIQPK